MDRLRQPAVRNFWWAVGLVAVAALAVVAVPLPVRAATSGEAASLSVPGAVRVAAGRTALRP